MNGMKFTVKDDQKTLVIERTFTAPKSKVWAAWTTPALFKQWWGPRGWSTIIKEMDVKPGGRLHYGMKCEDPAQKERYGQVSWGVSRYKAVDAENALAYTDVFSDENGAVDTTKPEMNIRVEFIEANGATRVVSTSTFASPEDLQQVMAMGMEEGTRQTWDRLAVVLAK